MGCALAGTMTMGGLLIVASKAAGMMRRSLGVKRCILSGTAACRSCIAKSALAAADDEEEDEAEEE